MFDLQNGKKHGRGMYACSLGSLESLHEKSDASFFCFEVYRDRSAFKGEWVKDTLDGALS